MKLAEEHYKNVRNRAEQRLFCIPGVVGVALGPKIVAGKLTSSAAIQVLW